MAGTRSILMLVLMVLANPVWAEPPAADPGVSRTAAAPGRHEACLQRCAVVEVECSSSARGARQACMKRAATGGVDPFTQRRELGNYFCAWFGNDHCGDRDGDFRACAARYLARYELCNGYFRDNTARQYLDCGAGEREALGLCRAELIDCRASCGE